MLYTQLKSAHKRVMMNNMNEVGSGILTLLAETLLPAIISTFTRWIIYSIVQMFSYKLLNSIQGQTLKIILILII